MITRHALVAILSLILVSPSVAWDGTDQSSGNNVEIERGQTVRPGRDIEYFDYGLGAYKSLSVDSVRRFGSSVEIEGTNESGESVILEMDD